MCAVLRAKAQITFIYYDGNIPQRRRRQQRWQYAEIKKNTTTTFERSKYSTYMLHTVGK